MSGSKYQRKICNKEGRSALLIAQFIQNLHVFTLPTSHFVYSHFAYSHFAYSHFAYRRQFAYHFVYS